MVHCELFLTAPFALLGLLYVITLVIVHHFQGSTMNGRFIPIPTTARVRVSLKFLTLSLN